MGILDEYRKKESDRIETLYKKSDCMTEGQVDELIKYVFTGFYDQGFAGQAAARSLILKINKVLNIRYVPSKGEFEKWHKEFCLMNFEIKKSLLVTVANDLCKMSIFTETQILEKVDTFLKDIPGVLADTREI
jgi:hypothetical protein